MKHKVRAGDMSVFYYGQKDYCSFARIAVLYSTIIQDGFFLHPLLVFLNPADLQQTVNGVVGSLSYSLQDV